MTSHSLGVHLTDRHKLCIKFIHFVIFMEVQVLFENLNVLVLKAIPQMHKCEGAPYNYKIKIFTIFTFPQILHNFNLTKTKHKQFTILKINPY